MKATRSNAWRVGAGWDEAGSFTLGNFREYLARTHPNATAKSPDPQVNMNRRPSSFLCIFCAAALPGTPRSRASPTAARIWLEFPKPILFHIAEAGRGKNFTSARGVG